TPLFRSAERDRHREGGYDQTVDHRVPQRSVGKELAIPFEGPTRRRKSAYAGAIEGINHQDNDREIKKRVNQPRIYSEKRSTLRGGSGVHETFNLFSRRSVVKRSAMTMTIMKRAIAAPSGQL